VYTSAEKTLDLILELKLAALTQAPLLGLIVRINRSLAKPPEKRFIETPSDFKITAYRDVN